MRPSQKAATQRCTRASRLVYDDCTGSAAAPYSSPARDGAPRVNEIQSVPGGAHIISSVCFSYRPFEHRRTWSRKGGQSDHPSGEGPGRKGPLWTEMKPEIQHLAGNGWQSHFKFSIGAGRPHYQLFTRELAQNWSAGRKSESIPSVHSGRPLASNDSPPRTMSATRDILSSQMKPDLQTTATAEDGGAETEVYRTINRTELLLYVLMVHVVGS